MSDLIVRGARIHVGMPIAEAAMVEVAPIWNTHHEFQNAPVDIVSADQAVIKEVGAVASQEVVIPKLAVMPPRKYQPYSSLYKEPAVLSREEMLRGTFSVTYPKDRPPLVVETGAILNPKLVS